MKAHPRIRKTVKWGGAVVSVGFFVAWAASVLAAEWKPVVSTRYWTGPGNTIVSVRAGYVSLNWMSPNLPPPRYMLSPHPVRLTLWPFRYRDTWLSWLTVPLGGPAIVFGLMAVGAWRLEVVARRRDRVGLCRKCHYDRTGLAVGAVCPECGTPS